MQNSYWHLIWLLPLLGLPIVRWLLIPLLSPLPAHIAAEKPGMPPCPALPNCSASSQANRSAWPLGSHSSTTLATAIEALPGCQLRTHTPNYLHAECCSRLWGFVDDLELYIEQSTKRIHYRSASRLGYSDFGINRQRLAELKALLEDSN